MPAPASRVIVEQAAADEEIGGRAEHRDRTAVAQQRQFGIVEMDAMPEKRARAEQAEPGIDRRVARIARKQALDRVDLVAVLGEMRLHQDGGKLRQQRARRRELFVARGDGEARGHGIALPPGAVPAPDEIAAVGDGGGGGSEQPRRRVAVHEGIARDHAGVAAVRGRKQRGGRIRMRRAVGKRRGGAVARQLVEEKFGVARGVRGIGEFLLFDEGVFLQPFEELRAIGGDHLRLRVVDMGVDESGQNQRVGVMFDRELPPAAAASARAAGPAASMRPSLTSTMPSSM